ncbi:MAG TPA: carboxypeptidase regulatory-like domain-containing protein, partial [Vulgatibacter sp.]
MQTSPQRAKLRDSNMRRRLLLASFLALAAIVAAVAIFGGGPASTPRDDRPSDEPGFSAAIPARRSAPAPGVDPGYLQGTVIGVDGGPAPGSEVRVLDGEATVATAIAGTDGSFRLGPLRPGDLLLVARSGSLASEPVGPIPLAPGEELGGIALHLVPGGSLAGTILDAGTGEPIAGAVASAAGLTSVTDRLGRFLLQGLSSGELAFHATASGYGQRSERVEIGSGPTEGLEIRLTKSARISGRVVSGDGRPVAGASVFVVEYRLREAGRRLAGVTGASGSFDLPAPAGQVIVEAVDPAGGTGRSEILGLSPGTSREGLEIRIAEAASLSGNVVDESGEPVPGAQVYAAAGDRLSGGVTTDAEGRFAMGGIAPGMIQVVAVSGAARARVGPLEILEGEPVTITLQIGSGALRGSVVDASGRG